MIQFSLFDTVDAGNLAPLPVVFTVPPRRAVRGARRPSRSVNETHRRIETRRRKFLTWFEEQRNSCAVMVIIDGVTHQSGPGASGKYPPIPPRYTGEA